MTTLNWFTSLILEDSVAHTLLLYSFVIMAGMALSHLRIKGVSFGVACVLFVGFIVGWFKLPLNPDVVDFAKNFGLVMFIFGVGMEAGPNFFSSIKSGGIKLVEFTLLCVLMGTGLCIALAFIFPDIIDIKMMAGLMNGTVNCTPGLGASQEGLNQLHQAGLLDEVPDISVAYAVGYPIGILGVITAIIILGRIKKVDMRAEEQKYNRNRQGKQVPHAFAVRMTNPKYAGMTVKELRSQTGTLFTLARIRQDGKLIQPRFDTVLKLSDSMLLYAPEGDVDKITEMFGEKLTKFDGTEPGDKLAQVLVVSDAQINGKTIGSLNLRKIYSVNIVSVIRGELKLMPSPELVLHLGDRVMVTGSQEAISSVSHIFGNKVKSLYVPHLFSIFMGITCGIIFGMLPIRFPGMDLPIRLGLAGGPLLVALAMSAFGYKIGLIAYATQSANQMVKQIGLCMFLCSVGLMAGPNFFVAAFSMRGLAWVAMALVISVLPALLTGMLAMKKGFSYPMATGIMSGTLTSAPVLGYAGSLTETDAPAVGFSAVYPMTLILRLLMAELIVLI